MTQVSMSIAALLGLIKDKTRNPTRAMYVEGVSDPSLCSCHLNDHSHDLNPPTFFFSLSPKSRKAGGKQFVSETLILYSSSWAKVGSLRPSPSLWPSADDSLAKEPTTTSVPSLRFGMHHKLHNLARGPFIAFDTRYQLLTVRPVQSYPQNVLPCGGIRFHLVKPFTNPISVTYEKTLCWIGRLWLSSS